MAYPSLVTQEAKMLQRRPGVHLLQTLVIWDALALNRNLTPGTARAYFLLFPGGCSGVDP